MLGGSTRAMDGPQNATAQEFTILMRDIGHVNSCNVGMLATNHARVQGLLRRMASAEKKECALRAAKTIQKFKKIRRDHFDWNSWIPSYPGSYCHSRAALDDYLRFWGDVRRMCEEE